MYYVRLASSYADEMRKIKAQIREIEDIIRDNHSVDLRFTVEITGTRDRSVVVRDVIDPPFEKQKVIKNVLIELNERLDSFCVQYDATIGAIKETISTGKEELEKDFNWI